MSTKSGRIRGHLFHGDPKRFGELAFFIHRRYGNRIKSVADVAGGQGMLTRILHKKYNYDSEVIDTRESVLVGAKHRKEEYVSDMADYYDLIVGLHPDQAIRAVAESALVTPTILIPCCNFWDRTKRLGRDALLTEISKYYDEHNIRWEKIMLDFEGPKNIGFITEPPKKKRSC